MAVDKNAVREGTRWMVRGREVVVGETTPRSVIFFEENALGATAMEWSEFTSLASDPATEAFDRLTKAFGRGRNPQPGDVEEAIAYLLARLGPPAAANPLPVPEPMKAEPVVMVEAKEIQRDPEPDAERCSEAPADYPPCEPMPAVFEERPTRKPIRMPTRDKRWTI